MSRIGAASLVAAIVAFTSARARALTKEDIIEMSRAGVSESILLDTLEGLEDEFQLSTRDISDLRAAGVPEAVIAQMAGKPLPPREKRSDRRGASPASQEEARRAAEEFRRAEEERREEEAGRARAARQSEMALMQIEAEALQKETEQMAAKAEEAERQTERRKAEIDDALKKAFERLDGGDCVEAAEGFWKFLRGGMVPPNSFLYVEGEYGLGEALFRCGYVVGSLPRFVEVLRRGPVTRRFAPALRRLGDAMERVVYDHPIFELLAKFEADSLDKGARDEQDFFLGQFFSRFADRERARKRFGQVSKGSSRYAAARYHLGVLDVAEEKFKSAVKRFEESVKSAQRKGDQDLTELAHLALARVALENQAFDGASFYYDKIGGRSDRAVRARYEKLWTTFMQRDYSKALGLMHALDSPYYDEAFIPDLRVLEATVYLNLCRFEDARKASEEARVLLTPLVGSVKSFLRTRRSVAEYFRALTKEKLPAKVEWAVAHDLEFVALRDTVVQLDGEERKLKNIEDKTLVAALEKVYQGRKKTLLDLTGLAVTRVLRDITGEIEEMRLRATEVLFEVEFAEKEQLLQETTELYQGDEAKKQAGGKGKDKPKGGKSLARTLGKLDQPWPFQGEYWEDEVDSYESVLVDQCGQQ